MDDATYEAFGRIFPDPHGCFPRMPPFSKWAKGNVCAADFIQFDEMVAGLGFLQEKFPGFVDLFRLDERFKNPEYMSAGLATADLSHEPNPLWMVRITDESVPDAKKKRFLFPLSIHGIERAGAEGGIRAAEDLATWAACEQDADTSPACAAEDPLPHPILETSPDVSLTAGEALKRAAVHFIFPNPDGWRRGDRNNGAAYMRYNGNGIDLNRDWPTIGYTFEPYTPFSEPESRAFGEALRAISTDWDGGIDLHGQLNAPAFSFTLLGAGPNDFGENQATLDVVEGAWRDAETRLAWSELIKPNDAPVDDPRLYGVQWGTVWDTINYTTTGSLGDWIGSPLGLNAEVAIDNEMSLSHISNCGTGVCFIPDVEQLHVDGNKSLVYSMINFHLRPESQTFPMPGRAAYLHNSVVRSRSGYSQAKLPFAGLKPQDDILAQLDPTNDWIYEFDVLGPADKVLNRGFKVQVRAGNVAAVSPAGAASEVFVERMGKEDWELVNSYYNQGDPYAQAGMTVDVNDPEPGHWRLRIATGEAGLLFNAQIDFRETQAWPNPVQLPYKATNLDFFTDLNEFAQRPFESVTADDILSGAVDLSTFDSLVIADQMLSGFVEPPRTGPAQDGITFAGADGSNPTYPCGSPTTVDPAPPGCETYFEWDVDAAKNNQSMTVQLSWASGTNDFDLYVERFVQNGQYWGPVGQSAGSAMPEIASVLKPLAGHYRARVLNWASAEPLPQELAISFSNAAPKVKLGTRTTAELQAFAKRLRGFVEGGGNLVLTDGALRLLAAMGVVERHQIHDFAVYAGFIGFTPDGEAATYDLPLARNVQRPGAAEGPGHRHQTYEPVPIGYAIQDESGGNTSTAPVWAVDQVAWQAKGGVTAGTTTGDQVTLGELKLGKGVVRVIGALLPMPTDAYFHPFGLESYAVTYSGYQVFQNAMSYTNPARTKVGGAKVVRPKGGSQLPATGVGVTWIGIALAVIGLAGTIRLRRRAA